MSVPQNPAPTHAPLAVIGMACLFPQADNLGAYWANIRHGRDGITAIPESHWRVADYYDADPKKSDHTYAKRGGFIPPVPFDCATYGIAPHNLEATDVSQLLGLAVADAALAHAGYGAMSDAQRQTVSVILGVTGTLQLVIPLGARLGHPQWRQALLDAGVSPAVANDVVARIADSYVPWQENSFPGLLGNVVAGRIANRLNLGGTNCVVDAACASSLSATHMAALELNGGRADMVITGGVDTFNDIFMYMCFSKTPALSPSGDSRPFDAAGDGTILGEGIGMVVLKRLADAERDGDCIYAVLKGIGTSSDGRGKAIYAPSAQGQIQALNAAYQQASVTPDTIELVEAHGTGTKVGDAIELDALRQVYGKAQTGAWCALGSVKSQIGHTKAAAGAAGLLKAALALHHKVLPPTLKVNEPLEALQAPDCPFYLNTAARPWLKRPAHPRRAALSAFGFGGSNFHAVLEEFGEHKAAIDWHGDHEVVCLGADTPDGITAQFEQMRALSEWHAWRLFAHQSRARFRVSDTHRLVFIVEADPLTRTKWLDTIQAHWSRTEAPWSLRDGAWCASGAAPGALAAIFPGQGSQYVDMGRDWACQFPEAFDAWQAAEDAFETVGTARAKGCRLIDCAMPPAAFSEAAKQQQAVRLRETDAAQVAIGAMSMGLWQVLQRFGVQVSAVAGHSYGELTALWAAGRLQDADYLHLSALRGSLMHAEGHSGGAMLAVHASAKEVLAALESAQLPVVIANYNAPRQVVLSGPIEAIDAATKRLEAQKLRSSRLPVGAAFHSPLVAAAQVPFAEALKAVPFQDAQVPVYANTTAELYPEDARQAQVLLGGQLAQSVNWEGIVRRMLESGVRTFVEVGPQNRLNGLVQAIATDYPGVSVISLDAQGGKRRADLDLAHTLGHLAALGYLVDWSPWQGGDAVYEGLAARKTPKMAVMLSGVNHRSTQPAPRPATLSHPVDSTKSLEPASTVGVKASTPAAPAGVNSRPGVNATPIATNGASPVNSAAATVISVTASVNGAQSQVVGSIAPPLTPNASPAAQQALLALQQLASDTARLHAQFLETQSRTQQMVLQWLNPQAVTNGHATAAANGHGASPSNTGLTAPSAPIPNPYPLPQTPAAQPSASTSVSAPRQPEGAVPPLGMAGVAAPMPRTIDNPTNANQCEGPATPSAQAGSGAVAAKLDETDPLAVEVAAQLQQRVLTVVAEKTGYPVEMLGLEMSLEADLGIDSIKRVEIMAALQQALPQAEPVAPERLGSLVTLQDVLAALSKQAVRSPVTGASGAVATKRDDVPQTDGLSGVADAQLQQRVLTVVAEKTGYPVEMLGLEMSLEADLGIDSIKRVEIMAALQQALPQAEPVAPERLGSLVTLQDVLAALSKQAVRSPVTGASGAVATKRDDVPQTDGLSVEAAAQLQQRVLTVVAEKTGYPVEMLGLEMSLEADLGIDSIKRVEIMAALQQALPQAEPVAPERLGSLVTLQDVLAALSKQAVRSPVTGASGAVATKRDDVPQTDGLSVDELVMRAQPVSTEPWRVEPDALVWIAHQGVCDLSAELVKQLTGHGAKAQAVDIAMPEAWPEATGLYGVVLVAPANQVLDSRSMYQLTQHVAPVLRAAKQGFVVGITRMDGAFGLGHASGNESSGALSGLVKGLAWEWPALRCRVLDVDADQYDREAMAAQVLPELWRKGPVELGLSPQGQCVLELTPSRTRPAASAAALAPQDVVLVTGGARGVTAACAIALAEALRPTLVLLGRSPLPGPEASWLAGCDDEAAIKQALRIHEPACNTPRLLQQRAQVILAEKAIRETLASINQLGVPVHYVSVDVRDASAVKDAVTTVRQTLGPIRGLIHGAGVIADRLIHEKSIAQFDAVFETKVVGLQAIMAATDPGDLKALILFSSVTGRQGRSGQSDYAMANEWLNKFAQAFARRYPACLVRALNWGPWDGGMVTRAHKRLFAAEGVGVVPLEAGARWLAQTLGSAVASGVEQVILGTLPEAKAVASKQPELVQDVFAFELDPTRDAWLDDHRLRGRSVLPAALMIDWLLLAASLTQPGLSVRSLRHFTVLKGLVLDESRQSIHGVIEHTSRNGETTAVQAALVTRGHDGQTVRHASAELEVGEQLSQDVGDVALALPVGRYPLRIDDAYGRHLFHGATWRGIERITAFSPEGVAARLRCAPVPQAWLSETLQETWMADPLVIDCVFQLLILWSVHHLNAPCLPARVGSLERYFEAFPSQGCDVVISCVSKHPHELVAAVELRDGAGLLLARMQDVVATVSAQLVEAFGVEASVPR